MKILIADASAVYKRMFARVLAESDGDAEFVTDGEQALEQILNKKFDIIIIDAEIAGVGALELLNKINKDMPDASVLITARPSSANSRLCVRAFDEGAFDCMDKPIYASYAENLETVRKSMAKVFAGKQKSPRRISMKNIKFKAELVLIAASTGGPSALEKILSKLSADFPAPVLIVQHMTPNFIETLVQNLDAKSDLKIKVAEDGELASAGTAYIAPGGTHIKLGADNRIYFDGLPPINGVRPAADVLFASAAESFSGGQILCVILTGMGRDGEIGLAKLKGSRECLCIVQSERTCVVYGMPRAAAERGFADKILDLDEIALEMLANTEK